MEGTSERHDASSTRSRGERGGERIWEVREGGKHFGHGNLGKEVNRCKSGRGRLGRAGKGKGEEGKSGKGCICCYHGDAAVSN